MKRKILSIAQDNNRTRKMAKVKSKVRKLYTFSTPYSQSAINQESATKSPQGNTQVLIFDFCDILDGVAASTKQKHTPGSNDKQNEVQKRNSNEGQRKQKEKHKVTASAIVVDGQGITVREKVVSKAVIKSPQRTTRVAEKKMMRLKVIGTIFKMKQELDVIRKRRLRLAKKLHNGPTPQEE